MELVLPGGGCGSLPLSSNDPATAPYWRDRWEACTVFTCACSMQLVELSCAHMLTGRAWRAWKGHPVPYEYG